MERASNWWAANNRYTEGRLKVPGWRTPFSTSLAHHHLDLELRTLLTQFHDGLAGLGTERLARALV